MAEVVLTEKQEEALRRLCSRYAVLYDPADYAPAFDLPEGYVAGWVGGTVFHGPNALNGKTIYVGVSPEGEVSS